jgi:hypothetical protein
MKTTAEECKDCNKDCPTQISTEPGDANHCPMIPVLKLDSSNPTEIQAGNSIEVKLLDGDAPFIWGDPGNGYTWVNGDVIDADKPKIKKTTGRANTLHCASGT